MGVLASSQGGWGLEGQLGGRPDSDRPPVNLRSQLSALTGAVGSNRDYNQSNLLDSREELAALCRHPPPTSSDTPV